MSDPLTGASLTETGLALPAEEGQGRTLVIACGALAREILALIRLNRWEDRLALTCLPAILHNYPDRIVPRLRERIARARAEGYGEIVVGYADCGTGGGIDRLCAEEGVSRIDGPHCYSFFEGNEAHAARGDEDMRSFYLTDFLARQFETLIWKGFGMDRHPDLRDMLFGHYRRIVWLVQVPDPETEAKARAAASRLDLEFEMRETGYGDLAPFLAGAAGISRS